ncbi:MAG: DUF5011 domain-containing protein, partial [Nitrosopumilus sp.]|nr:DUF5011 domain-containing protein [Nitrosopumilus sp.]
TDVQGVQSMPPDTSVDPIRLTFTCTGPVHNNTNEDSIYVREREPDLVPPVILDVDGTEGLAPATVRQGIPYVYMEPTCTDDAHPSLPVTRTASVDTSVVGVQQVTYECTDFSLNTATAQRQVTVIHNHDPFVRLEPPVVVHQDDTPFQYDGASCIDDSEDLVPVQSGDEVTGFVEGLFRITYTCTDSAGNSGSSVLPVLVNRTVTAQYENVRLETGPKSVIYVAQDASSPDVHGTLVMANVTCTADPFGQTPLDVSFEVEYVQPGGNSFDREQVLLTDLGIHHVYYECLGMNDQRDIHVMDRPSIDYGIDADVAVIEVDGDFEDRAVCSNWASSLPLSGEEARAPGSHTFLEGSLVSFERAGKIDNSTAGILSTLTYTCTDRIGQTLTDSRDVLVRDSDPPEIIIGEPELLHPLNEAFNHTRVCRDMAEGDKPASYVPESGIDVTLLAEEQTLVYYCEDSAGNEAINKTLSVVVVEGDSALHLEMHGHSVTYHENGTAYEDPGAVCLSTNLGLRTIRTITDVDPDEAGTYGISYACNAGADRASLSRVVHVVDDLPEDTAKPSVILEGDRVEVVDRYTAYRDPGASCDDAVSGTSAPSSISVTSLVGGVSTTTPYGVVDPTVIGTYVTTYECTDQAGNKEVGTRTTHVVDAAMPAEDTDGPSIRINGTHLFVQAQNAPYRGMAYCYDNVDGAFMIDPDVPLETDAAGRFNIVFTCEDDAGNTGGSAAATALVRDIVPPDVVITGAPEVERPWTEDGMPAYEDEGAVCDDDVDDDKPAELSANGVRGNEDTIGTYHVTYTCTDQAGNTATKNRTVSVVADTLPTFDLTRPAIDVLVGTEFVGEAYDVGTCKHPSRDDYEPTFIKMTRDIDTSVMGNTGEAQYGCSTNVGTRFQLVQIEAVEEDRKPPVITIIGENPAVRTNTDTYRDQGATCYDAFDGVIDTAPKYRGDRYADSDFMIDTRRPSLSHPYYHLYECTDDAGNREVAARPVVPTSFNARLVMDGVPPRVFDLSKAVEGRYTGAGFKCYYPDGHIEQRTDTGTFTGVSKTDTRTLTLVCGTRGTAAGFQAIPTIFMVDRGAPEFSSGPHLFEYKLGVMGPLPTCTDTVGTTTVTVAGERWDINKPGNYTVEFTCRDGQDSLGHENFATATGSIQVGDPEPPVLEFESDNLFLHFEDPFSVTDGATCTDNPRPSNLGKPAPVITTNYSKTEIEDFGVGHVNATTYSCKDADGNSAVNMTRFIHTIDAKRPNLVVTGIPDPYRVDRGERSAPSASCTDTRNNEAPVTVSLQRMDGTKIAGSDNSTIILSAAGRLQLNYTCTNVSDVSAHRIVNVNVTGTVSLVVPPVPAYTGSPPIQECQTIYCQDNDADELNYHEPVCTDSLGNDITPELNAASDMISRSAGYYDVVFRCTDQFGNSVVSDTQKYRIIDKIPPVPVLVGGKIATTDSFKQITTGKDRIITGITGRTLVFEDGSEVTLSRNPVLSIPDRKLTHVTRADGVGVRIFTPTALTSATTGWTYFIANDATLRVTEWGESSPVSGNVNFDLNGAPLRLASGDSARITLLAGSNLELRGDNDELVLRPDTSGLDTLVYGLGPAFDPSDHLFCIDETDDRNVAGTTLAITRINKTETVMVQCADRARSMSSAQFTIRTVDVSRPVLTLGPAIDFAVVNMPYNDPATCIDNLDGNITDTITKTPKKVDTSMAGEVTIMYDCADWAGNAAGTKTRTVNVVDSAAPDNVPPRIEANWMNDTIAVGGSYGMPGATCIDGRDGQIDVITTTRDYRVYIIPPGEEDPRYVSSDTFQTEPDTSRAGLHTVTYACRDSAGNTNSTTVVLGVVNGPVIRAIPDEDPTGHIIGIYEAYPDPGAMCWNEAGALPVATTDDINNILPGTYMLTYACRDGIHPEVTATRDVVVRDSVVPVVRIVNQTHDVEVGRDYDVIDNADCFDYDWRAKRTVELDLNATITQIAGGGADGDPVVAPPGELRTEETAVFRVEYDCEDPAGNLASDNPRRDRDSRISVVPSSDDPDVRDGVRFALLGDNPAERERKESYGDDAGAVCTDGTRDYPIRYDASRIDPEILTEQKFDVMCHVASDDVRTLVRRVLYSDNTPPDIMGQNTTLRLQPGATHVADLSCTDSGDPLPDTRTRDNSTASRFVEGAGHVITAPGATPTGYNTTHVRYWCLDYSNNTSANIIYEVITDTVEPYAVFTGRAAGGIQYVMPEDGATYGDNPLKARCADDHPGAILTEVASTPSAAGEPVSTDRNFTAVHECIDEAGNPGMTDLLVVVDGTAPADPVGLEKRYEQAAGAPFVPSMARGDTECPPDEVTTLRTAPIRLMNETTLDGGTEPVEIDTSAAGTTYVIRYWCMDLANNTSAQIEQTVPVRNAGDPTTRFVGQLATDKHVNNTKYYKPGITCTDDATDEGVDIQYKPRLDTITADGDYEVQVFCPDSLDRVSDDVNMTVTITLDTIPPVITLTGGDTTVRQGGQYNEPVATCNDPPHGDISGRIVKDPDPVQTGVIGPVTVTYDCTDLAENAAEQVTHDLEVTPVPGAGTVPVIKASPATIHFRQGTDPPRPDVLECADGTGELGVDLTGRITNDSSIRMDRNTPNGEYTIQFTCRDDDGNEDDAVITYIADGTRPVITPGNGTIPLELGGTLVAEAVTCMDPFPAGHPTSLREGGTAG